MTNPESVNSIEKEFEQCRGSGFKYEPLVGDRVPALDYRVKKITYYKTEIELL